MKAKVTDHEARIKELEERLAEAEQIIDAIKAGEVDAIAVNAGGEPEIYTLQSGDYSYRLLIEEFGEGAVNLTDDGLIVYTNTSFFEMLQLPYEKVVGCLFTDFIHAESREKFAILFSQALTAKSKGEINLSVNNKTIPVYISLASLQPKLPTISVIITDFTEKKRNEEMILEYQQELEKKNRELMQSNTELASFTYIASHDLQEPLRKIQAFSDRILDVEEELSPLLKNYFERIMAASLRMQNLISALLRYSSTSAAEMEFIPTDLNAILQDVCDNLADIMDETGTVIEISPLPTLNILPTQFDQFFTNIISNSIKYRRANVPLVIEIEASIVPAAEIAAAAARGNFWRINIKDNGIGFEPQYSEKIFEVFQRLTPDKYEGTGIGLAICKKIIQNHKGFIKASSQPGVGSTFTIYLPANNVL